MRNKLGGELREAAENGQIELIKRFLKEGAAVDARDKTKWTALHFAIAEGHFVCADFLIKAGADIHLKSKDSRTVLHTATFNGNIDGVRYAIDRSVDINATTKGHGWTALYMAIDVNHEKIVRLLLENGADPYITDKTGRTPLEMAKQRKLLSGVADILSEFMEAKETHERLGETIAASSSENGLGVMF